MPAERALDAANVMLIVRTSTGRRVTYELAGSANISGHVPVDEQKPNDKFSFDNLRPQHLISQTQASVRESLGVALLSKLHGIKIDNFKFLAGSLVDVGALRNG